MTSVEEIEQSISPLLLTDITFSIENKSVKKGRLILFSVKDFFCVFTLANSEKSNKRIIYEIPYPFTITANISSATFDYTLNEFSLGNSRIIDTVDKLKFSKTSKFFDKRVVVSINR